MRLSQKLYSILFPKYVWKKKTTKQVVYLTFDDGPIPDVTEWVLDTLKHYNIKATFFCIGDNINKHPDIFERIIKENHQVGNHTFNHLNGWKTHQEKYRNNVLECETEIRKYTQKEPSCLFRPPYGKITKSQAKYLSEKLGLKIIMWTMLTKDYDKKTTPEECLRRATCRIKPGSIIVFHDSIKARKNMMYALPKAIEILQKKGYSFAVL